MHNILDSKYIWLDHLSDISTFFLDIETAEQYFSKPQESPRKAEP